MKIGESIKLPRDTEVVQIPEGYRVRLARGTDVKLMQALGDTYTVMTEYHTMVRIDYKDADVLGIVRAELSSAPTTPVAANAEELKEQVWTALRSVYDPEIPVNVVELGLVYKNEIIPVPEGGYRVDIDLTLTAPGCGMGHVLKEDAERKIGKLPGVKQTTVQLVVDPPWNQGMMSEAARLELGL